MTPSRCIVHRASIFLAAANTSLFAAILVIVTIVLTIVLSCSHICIDTTTLCTIIATSSAVNLLLDAPLSEDVDEVVFAPRKR